MRTPSLIALFLVLLIFSVYLPLQKGGIQAQTVGSTNSAPIPGEVIIVVGKDTTNQESIIQTKRTLEHQGLLYQIITDDSIQAIANKNINLIIVLGSTNPQLETSVQLLKQKIVNGTSMIWISSGLPKELYDVAGLSQKEGRPNLAEIKAIQYAKLTTEVFNETLDPIQPDKATVQGYFSDNHGQEIAPAELSYKQNQNGWTYYFAYDVCSWWAADINNPWLRAYRLELAIDNALSNEFTVRLAPYPQNARAAFITRIEDVDPVHTSQEWLTRATHFLDYYTEKNAPLTVAVIPRYIDIKSNTNISLTANTANDLRNWLSTVIVRGGTVIQHGFTHQYDDTTTGVAPEFYNAQGQWLSFEAQQQRIQTGTHIILQSLKITPQGFEAPHYIANSDTYQALCNLGFKYTTHNTNSPYAEQYGYSGLINIPETLGYLPLNDEDQTQATIKANMDILYNLTGTMLYFNHLFTDSSLNVGENLVNYALSMPNIWMTNADNLAAFTAQRFNAYQSMNIQADNEKVTINIGSCNIAGLSLTLSNADEIKSVAINGQQWPTFNQNNLILPQLPNARNTVTIYFNTTQTNVNATLGYIVLSLSVASSIVLLSQTAVIKHFRRKHE